MIIDTKHVFALAAAIAVAGIVTVELSRSEAEAAEQSPVMSYTQAYSAARVDTAFDLVATLPESSAFTIPMAMKGDLPVPAGCSGDSQAECMDIAYEVESEPSLIVESRFDNGSTLMRMDSMTVADMNVPVQ